MKSILLIATLAVGSLVAKAQIIVSDYSDPDVCEGTQQDYWLTASSFQCAPGLPILHSNDLQHWTLVNYALKGVPSPTYDPVAQLGSFHGKGVWAPSIRLHGDTYYIYWGDPDQGIFMVKTKDPAGQWDEPVLVVAGKGLIDPCPLWDEDGRVYLINAWAASRSGFNSVLTMRQLNAEGTRAITSPVLVYDGQVEGNHTVEGPKLYKRNGYYYILAPAGGVEQGWQLALRSRHINGPYESKKVFHKDGIHQGGWVGNAFIGFQDRGPYGRILHLLDVQDKDGWPMMKLSKQNKPQPLIHLASPYQWHANYSDTFGFEIDHKGNHTTTPSQPAVRVYSHNMSAQFKNCWEVPNLYLRKFEGETFCDTLHLCITAKTDGQQSGFIVMGRDYCRLSAELCDGKFILSQHICHEAESGAEEETTVLATLPARRYEAGAKPNYECRISFRIECENTSKGSAKSAKHPPVARCQLSYSLDHGKKWQSATTFQARQGKWIGAKHGLFSLAPHNADKGWVELLP